MENFLYSIDLAVFYFINHNLANSLFDKFFPFITEVKNWYIAYIILLCICFYKGGRIGKISAIGSIILVALSDQLSSFVIKDLISRIRPCIALTDVRILTGCTDSYSFPSSHAVNNFAVSVFFARIFPRIKWILYITAFLIAFSRVYVGRHYPSDVIGGAIIGAALGYLFSSVVLWLDAYFKKGKVS